MSRTRQAALATALVALLAAPLLTAATTHADDTGIQGQVDSMIELRLDVMSKDRLDATVTTTTVRTRLSAPGLAGKPTTSAFAGPVTGKRVVVHASSSAHGAETTITFGPQGP